MKMLQKKPLRQHLRVNIPLILVKVPQQLQLQRLLLL